MAEGHSHKFYIKIWAILLVLLIISLLGPELGNRYITIVTAFGIAIVKAWMVANYFMHLNVEKKYVIYLLMSMLIASGLFFAGTSPDAMHVNGRNWTNEAAKTLIDEHHKNPVGDSHGGK